MSSLVFAQNPMNEKQAIKESHIDFAKQYLFFTITGKIEIDGHEFINEKRKCPIIFKADLTGVAISDTCTKMVYQKRDCKIKGCPIIHLEEKIAPFERAEVFPPSYRFYNGANAVINTQ